MQKFGLCSLKKKEEEEEEEKKKERKNRIRRDERTRLLAKDVSLFLGWESDFHRGLPDLWRAALRAGLFLTFRPLTNLISRAAFLRATR